MIEAVLWAGQLYQVCLISLNEKHQALVLILESNILPAKAQIDFGIELSAQ